MLIKIMYNQNLFTFHKANNYKIIIINFTEIIMQEQEDVMQYNHSLEADMATGWKPKMRIIGPMPLNFDNPSLDNIIKSLIHSTSVIEIIYLGFRPRDTFQMHSILAKNYRYKFRHLLTTDYSHLKAFFRKFYSQFEPEWKPPFHGMNPKVNSSIIFQSRFQSGNLDCVAKVKPNQYDLFLRIDSNTCGHIMWYYFKVKNATDKVKTIRLNICNLRKSKTFYDKCLQPYVLRKNHGWRQQSYNLNVTEEPIAICSETNLLSNLEEEDEKKPQVFRKLSFDLNLACNEEVQVAYGIPYTYSQLLEDLKILKNQSKKLPNIEFEMNTSHLSLSGLQIPYVKINSKQEENQIIKRRTMVVVGRQHPGQSNASHVLKGFMQQLILSQEKQIAQLRKYFNFHIIPMLNPDGVVLGNFRTSLYGKDLNRLFKKSNMLMIPEVEFCKNLIFQLTKAKKKKIFMFLDFHGHSFQRNAFCFSPSTFELNGVEDVRQFPRIISETTQIFRFPSCSFRISNKKKTTARAAFCGDANLCYTIQTSNWSYYSKTDRINILFNQKLFQRLGSQLMQSLGIYFGRYLERKISRRKKIEGKKELALVLQHNLSGLLKLRSSRIQLKTQQDINTQKSRQYGKRKQLSVVSTQHYIQPSTTKTVKKRSKQTIAESLNAIESPQKNVESPEIISFENNEQIIEESKEEVDDDSDESDHEDMQKDKFKKYINDASKMLIQFQKAYYGEEYQEKARYELPKKAISKKKDGSIIIQQQPCLKPKNIDKGTLESERNLIKLKMQEKDEKKKKIDDRKGLHSIVKDQLKSLPRISIVNYIAYQEIQQKKVLKIPKIESMHIKNHRKYN